MAYTDEDRARVLALADEGLGPRAIARETGVSPATVKRWVAETPGPSQHNDRGIASADEATVAELLLRKAEELLKRIVALPDAKARSDQATAIDRLLGKYLALVGEPVNESEVNINLGDKDPMDLLAYLTKKAPEEAVPVGSTQEATT